MDDKPLTITQEEDADGGLVVRLSGTLDASTVTDAGRALRERPPAQVDLSELSFVDSSGLALLVGAHRHASAQGQRLEFVPPKGQPARALARMHLHTILAFTEPIRG